MRKIKIGKRLVLCFAFVLVLFIFSSGFSTYMMVQMSADTDSMFKYNVEPLYTLDDANAYFNLLMARSRHAFIVRDRSDLYANAKRDYQNALTAFTNALDDYKKLLDSDPNPNDEDIRLTNSVLDMWADYQPLLASILPTLDAGEVEQARALYSDPTLVDLGDALSDALTELFNYNLEMARDINNQQTQESYTTIYVLVAIAVVSVFATIIMAVALIRSITAPVLELKEAMNAMAAGDLNININSNMPDEIGDLTRYARRVIDIVNAIIADINHLAGDFGKGDIDAKIEESKYQGAYLEVASGVNNALGDIVKESLAFITCMVKFSEGDFNADIPKLPGKKAVMNTSRNQLRENLMGVNNDIAYLVRKASDGDLQTSIDAGKYKGDWHALVASLNSLMQAIATPIGEARESLIALSKGDLSARVTGSYKGEFDEIKKCVNTTMEAVGSYIQEIADVLGKMAQENDLRQEIRREYVGDFDQIKTSINMILNSINIAMSNFNSAAEQVTAGSKMIAESSMTLAQGATEQASAVQELNASVETINEQTKKSASDADAANELSVRSRENALRGNEEMDRMLASMSDIKASNDNISKINKVIEDIAFQTNLLALNAAVEAARAGEHGKGFTVVAEEVRNLASRSQNSSKETSELIQRSVEKIEEGQKIAASTAESLKTIVADVTQVSTIISGIATSAKDQADSIQQISIGLSQISEVVQNNTSNSEEAAATSEELSGQAETLKSMVAEFKTK